MAHFRDLLHTSSPRWNLCLGHAHCSWGISAKEGNQHSAWLEESQEHWAKQLPTGLGRGFLPASGCQTLAFHGEEILILAVPEEAGLARTARGTTAHGASSTDPSAVLNSVILCACCDV